MAAAEPGIVKAISEQAVILSDNFVYNNILTPTNKRIILNYFSN